MDVRMDIRMGGQTSRPALLGRPKNCEQKTVRNAETTSVVPAETSLQTSLLVTLLSLCCLLDYTVTGKHHTSSIIILSLTPFAQIHITFHSKMTKSKFR